MRLLVLCEGCKRQYDASGLAASSRFHCRCGVVLTVPVARVHDSAVIRCSACGGARDGSGPTCTFCGADFTTLERDMRTVCPSCMTRLSDQARFCHHCATPIRPEARAGARSEIGCPACGEPHHLNSRPVEGADSEVLECPRCAGFWLTLPVLQSLINRARSETPPALNAGARPNVARDLPRRQQGRVYRKCPVCAAMMHRQNYGKHSGVIVDACRAHGVWFDAQELDAILRWTREGGEAWTRERDRREADSAARTAKISALETKLNQFGVRSYGAGSSLAGNDGAFDLFDAIGSLGRLFDR